MYECRLQYVPVEQTARDAFRAIQYGDGKLMAGGAEGCICETGVAGFTSLTALSTSTDPMKASRPFDKDRDGFVSRRCRSCSGRTGTCKTTWCKTQRTCRIGFYGDVYITFQQKTEAVQPAWNLRWKKVNRTFPGLHQRTRNQYTSQ